MAWTSKWTASAFFAIALGVAGVAAAATSGKTSTGVEGVYNLEGVREMAATLILRPGNRFEFGAIYGGADPRANGTWSVEDGVVYLVSEKRLPKYTHVEQDSEPLLKETDSEGRTAIMGVMIASPALGMRWGDVNVIFKFANGRTSNGTTSRGGRVYAGALPQAEWKTVPITEIGLPLPEDGSKTYWIKVDNRKITRIAVELDPGGAGQAFRTASLEIGKGKPMRLVAGRLEGELRGTYVWKGPAKASPSPSSRSAVADGAK